MAASGGVHALLVLWLVLMPKSGPGEPPLTEITLLDPGDAGAASPAARASSSPETRSGALAESRQEQRFRRLARAADLDPDPQSRDALGDRIEARLASLQQRDVAAASVPLASPVSGWGATPATLTGAGGGGARLTLARGGPGDGGAPLPLVRGTGGAASLPAATLPAPRSAEADAPAGGGEVAARRSLAGATLTGPIADRAVLAHPAPGYPEWAKRDAVEGSVTLYFIVRPDGSVKENVLVQKTAGFEDFDERARQALEGWRFAALPAGRTGEQWGTITFHFRLREGG
jgi:TonB family protein